MKKKILLILTTMILLSSIFTGSAYQTSVDSILKNMTLEEKIGQMVIASFNGTTLGSDAKTLIRDYHIGGFALFKYNIQSESQLKALISDLNEFNKSSNIDLFLAVDEEGGRVSRIPSTIKKGPTALSLGQTNDPVLVMREAIRNGNNLSELGFNLNFAPSSDIFSNPQNTVIGDRAFGKDPQTAAIYSNAYYCGLNQAGIMASSKHFPGHGDTLIDSHYGLPTVTKTLDELREFELIPFNLLIQNNVDMIMMSHILLENIDPINPASLSYEIVTKLLREEMGYEGVIITDDMTMKAISDMYSPGESAVKAILAGCDIILSTHNLSSQIQVVEALKKAVENNVISLDRIDQSVRRILELKSKNNLL